MNKVCRWIGHKVDEGSDPFICLRCKETSYYKDFFSKTWYKEFWDDSGDLIKAFLWFIGIAGLIVGLMFLTSYLSNKAVCSSYIEIGIPAKWTGLWTGCMAEHPVFGWVPINKYFEIVNLYIP